MSQKNLLKNSKETAVLELILAGAIWGFGFVATKWILAESPPHFMNGARFFLACAVALPWLIRLYFKDPKRVLRTLKLSIPVGSMLGALVVLQTWGMVYTSATNSGFITTLYVLFVPVLEYLVFRKPLDKLMGVLVFLALLGGAMISGGISGNWNAGDLFTLACALVAAVHIVWIGQISHRIEDSFTFNVGQCFGAGLLSLMSAWNYEWVLPQSTLAWAGVVHLVVFSSLIGFMIQVRAQQVLSPLVSSLLFLLEAPFAAIFALLLLAEELSLIQWAGAALILAAAIGAVLRSSQSR